MEKRRTLTVSVATLLLAAVFITAANAAYNVSVTYPKFNSGTWTYYDMGSLQDSIISNVTNRLTYNTTTAEWVKVAFLNSSSGTGTGVILQMKYTDSVLNVYYIENAALGAGDVLVATGTWDENNTKVTLAGDKLNIWDADGILVTDFALSEPVRYIGVVGGTDYVTGGYVGIGVNQGVAGATAIVYEFIPIIVIFAMLGMVLGLLKKFGKI
jgi:hypothetical protein